VSYSIPILLARSARNAVLSRNGAENTVTKTKPAMTITDNNIGSIFGRRMAAITFKAAKIMRIVMIKKGANIS
jgi:hypothetical protein